MVNYEVFLTFTIPKIMVYTFSTTLVDLHWFISRTYKLKENCAAY